MSYISIFLTFRRRKVYTMRNKYTIFFQNVSPVAQIGTFPQGNVLKKVNPGSLNPEARQKS